MQPLRGLSGWSGAAGERENVGMGRYCNVAREEEQVDWGARRVQWIAWFKVRVGSMEPESAPCDLHLCCLIQPHAAGLTLACALDCHISQGELAQRRDSDQSLDGAMQACTPGNWRADTHAAPLRDEQGRDQLVVLARCEPYAATAVLGTVGHNDAGEVGREVGRKVGRQVGREV